MHGTQSYYDMIVAMVNCVIVVIVYTLYVLGPLELQLYFIVYWVIKRRQQKQLILLLEFNGWICCLHKIPSTIISQLK